MCVPNWTNSNTHCAVVISIDPPINAEYWRPADPIPINDDGVANADSAEYNMYGAHCCVACGAPTVVLQLPAVS